MKKIILLFTGLSFLALNNQAQTVTDIDGNIYHTVTIGSQVWLKENLNVSHYRNGDVVSNVADNDQWTNLTTGGCCNYLNDSNYALIYGKLYNGYAVMDIRKLCPSGWHASTEAEWETLISNLGGENVAGNKLMETGTTHWQGTNTGATNESGFTALPGSNRSFNGYFGWGNGEIGSWWTATDYPSDNTYNMYMEIGYGGGLGEVGGGCIKTYGYSVRCVGDYNGIEEGTYQDKIKIYPNPTTNYITIESISTTKKTFTLCLMNLQGQQLVSKKVEIDKTLQLDLSKFSNGIYFLTLQNENENYVSKVVIQH